MTDLKVRRRTRLKQKQSRALREELTEVLGATDLWQDGAAVEVGELPDFEVILVDGVIEGLRVAGEPFLSVRGVLAYRPSGHWVTVDMGAVRFVHNGADIMAPGITEADPELKEGSLCWIRDEKNGQPLAIGRALMSGADMGPAAAGKAVASVHHIGDKVWAIDA